MNRMVVLGVLGAATVAHADPLRVEIRPATTIWVKKQPVAVTLVVTNTSRARQTFQVMSCSWEASWKSNDAELTWEHWGCDKNFAMPIELEPGKSREWSLAMYASGTAKPGARDLAMTFAPHGLAPTKSATVRLTIR